MSFHTHHSLHNALLRRVRQHTALTTLFRAGSASVAPGTRIQPGGYQSEAGVPLVKATLLTGQNTFPEENSSPAMPVGGDALFSGKTTIQQAERPSQTEIQRPASKPVKEQAAAPPPKSQDRSWQLLKKIFRKHQEKTADPQVEPPKDTADQPVLSPLGREASLSHSEKNVPPPDPKQSEQVPQPEEPKAAPHETIGQLSSLEPMDVPDIPGNVIHTEPIENVSTPTTPREKLSDPVEQVSKSDLQQGPVLPVLPTMPIRRVSTPFPQSASGGTEHITLKPVEDIPAPDQIAHSMPKPENKGFTASSQPAPLEQPSEPGSPELHHLPIEAVWPVETSILPQSQGAGTEAARTSQSQPRPEPPTPPTRSPDDHPDPSTSAYLARVPTGQPTESHVEVIPPHRPRPSRRGSGSPPGVNQAPADRPPTVMNREQEAQQTALPDTRQPTTSGGGRLHANIFPDRLPIPPNPPTTQPDFQPSAPRATDASEHSNMVPTEIGPLPADLWHILKQSQPGSSEQTKAPVSPRSPLDAIPTQTGPGKEPANTTTKGDTLPALPPSPHAGNRVQRSPARDDIETDQSTTGLPEPAETSQLSTPQLDLNELANRVYLDIKRKLAVEWERSHRRG